MAIKTGMIKADDVPAYLARPEGEGPFPAIIIFFEAFGLNNHIKDVARRFAGEGYAAIAPDFYHRQPEPRTASYDDMQTAFSLASALTDEQAMSDTRASLDYLKQQPFVRAESIGAAGYCMGGRMAFLAACRFAEEIKAATPYYGGSIASPRRFGPAGTPPIEMADAIQARMLLFFGALDQHIPQEEVKTIEARLKEAGRDAEVIVYPNADHGFFCDERTSYNAEAAQDAWQKTIALFNRVLKR